jgi:acyl-CoA dehydrogenase
MSAVRSVDAVRAIALDVAEPAAAGVDRAGVFPAESVGALRSAGLLGVSVGASGRAWSVKDLADAATALGRACSSTGMIWAMHHSQALAVARHRGSGPIWDEIVAAVAGGDVLVASAASEGSGALSTADAAGVRTADGELTVAMPTPGPATWCSSSCGPTSAMPRSTARGTRSA